MKKKRLLCVLGIALLTGCIKKTEELPPSERPLTQDQLESIALEEEAMNNPIIFSITGEELAKQLETLDNFTMKREDKIFYVFESTDELVQIRFAEGEIGHIEVYTVSKNPTKDEKTLKVLKVVFQQILEAIGHEYDEEKLISILSTEVKDKQCHEEVYNSKLLIYYYLYGEELLINLTVSSYEEN